MPDSNRAVLSRHFCVFDLPHMDCNWSIATLGNKTSNYFQPRRSTASSVRSCGALAHALPAYHNCSLPWGLIYQKLDCVQENRLDWSHTSLIWQECIYAAEKQYCWCLR